MNHIIGFIPASRSYCSLDHDNFIAFRSYESKALLSRINPNCFKGMPIVAQHSGYALASASDNGSVWNHQIKKIFGLTAERTAFSTQGQVRYFRIIHNDDERYALVLYGANQVVSIYKLAPEGQKSFENVLSLGSKAIAKLEAVLEENRVSIYVLYEADMRNRSELKTYTFELNQGVRTNEPTTVTNNIFDFCVCDGRLIRLGSNPRSSTYVLEDFDTDIPVEDGARYWCTVATVKDQTSSNVSLLSPSLTTYAFVLETRGQSISAFVWNNRLYKAVHSPSTRELQHQHQDITLTDFGMKHSLLSLDKYGELHIRQTTIKTVSEEQQLLVESVRKIFNREGQIELFYEAALKTVLNDFRDFPTLEDYSYSMFKFLVLNHLEAFSDAFFLEDNIQLNSHSNFERFNKHLLALINELQVKLMQELQRAECSAASLSPVKRHSQNALSAARSMHLKVEAERERYLKLRSVGTRKHCFYTNSVAKYQQTRNRAESLTYVVSFLIRVFNPRAEKVELEKAVNSRIAVLKRLELASKQSRVRSQAIYIEQYFREFGGGYWTADGVPFNAHEFFNKIVRSHPFEVLYVLLGAIPVKEDPTVYFHISREDCEAVNAVRRLEDRQQSAAHLQCFDQLLNPSICVPNYFFIYLSKAALERQLSSTAIRILSCEKVELSSSTLQDFIDIHIRAYRPDLCYLQLKDYLADILDEDCNRTGEDYSAKEGVKQLITRAIEKHALIEVVRMMPAMLAEQQQQVHEELKRHNIKPEFELSHYVREISR